MNRDELAAAYLDGVAAVERTARPLSGSDWSMPACGGWTAGDTTRHLLCVAGWYHDWLDRALEGDTSEPFPAARIDAYAWGALDELAGLEPTAALDEYVVSARRYLDRVVDHWDLPYAYPSGVVTAGLHLGVAATEWHLHAWDLSSVRGERHRPADPHGLLVATGECVAAGRGGFGSAVMKRVIPVVARRRPWEQLLTRSGRTP